MESCNGIHPKEVTSRTPAKAGRPSPTANYLLVLVRLFVAGGHLTCMRMLGTWAGTWKGLPRAGAPLSGHAMQARQTRIRNVAQKKAI